MCRGIRKPSGMPIRSLNVLQAIEGMLRNQDGIQSVKVALLAERAVIEYDTTRWTTDKLVEVRPSFHVGYRVVH
jgi:copper chaperone CopZ